MDREGPSSAARTARPRRGPATRQQERERSAEIGRSLARATYEPDAKQRRLARLTTGRHAMAQSIAQHEAQLDQARRILAEHDHPLVWRLQRADAEDACAGIKWLPEAIKRDRAGLSATDAQIAQVERNLERAARLAERKPDLLAERAMISHQLEADLRARGVRATAEPASSRLSAPSRPTERPRRCGATPPRTSRSTRQPSAILAAGGGSGRA